MTGLNHGITGAVIAVVIKRPELALPLSFLSHFACDSLPHFGIKEDKHFSKIFNIVLVTDFLLSVSLMIFLAFLFPHQIWLIWSCMILAASPDLMWGYYNLYLQHIKKIKKPKLNIIARFHSSIQWSQTTFGLVFEALWFIFMASILAYHLA